MTAFKELHKKTNGQILKLARQGKLIDKAFKEFSRKVYPGAPPQQIEMMRICFFAGATELHAMLEFGADLTEGVSEADMDFWANVVGEIELFHRTTIAASDATGTPQ